MDRRVPAQTSPGHGGLGLLASRLWPAPACGRPICDEGVTSGRRTGTNPLLPALSNRCWESSSWTTKPHWRRGLDVRVVAAGRLSLTRDLRCDRLRSYCSCSESLHRPLVLGGDHSYLSGTAFSLNQRPLCHTLPPPPIPFSL